MISPVEISDESAPLQSSPRTSAANPLRTVRRIMRGRVLAGLLVGSVIGTVLAWAGYRGARPSFESESLIRVAPTRPKILFSNESNQLLPMFDTFVAAQTTLLSSRAVLLRALASEELRALGFACDEGSVGRLGEALKVVRPDKSEFIRVTANGESPRVARDIVRSLVDAFVAMNDEANRRTQELKDSTLLGRIEELRQALSKNQESILATGGEYEPNSLAEAHLQKVKALEVLQTRIADLEVAITMREAKDRTTMAMDPADKEIMRMTVLDHAMADLVTARADLAALLAAAAGRYKDKHPRVVELAAQLAVMDRALEDRREQLQMLGKNGLLTESGFQEKEQSIDEMKAVVEGLRRQEAEARAVAVVFHQKSLQLRSLGNERLELQSKLDDTQLELDRLRVESHADLPGRIEVAVEANVPFKPANDKRLAAGVVLGGFGGLIGFALVVIVGSLRGRVRYSDDLESLLPDSLVAVVPSARGRLVDDLPLITPLVQRLEMSPALLASKSLTVAVVGSDRADRSGLAEALAEAYSRSGLRTVLVVREHSGAAGVRAREQVATGFERVFSGNEENSGVCSRREVEAFVRRLRERADRIVVDGGPDVWGSYACYHASLADECLFVGTAGERLADAAWAVRRIEPFACERLHLVFTQATGADPGLPRILELAEESR